MKALRALVLTCTCGIVVTGCGGTDYSEAAAPTTAPLELQVPPTTGPEAADFCPAVVDLAELSVELEEIEATLDEASVASIQRNLDRLNEIESQIRSATNRARGSLPPDLKDAYRTYVNKSGSVKVSEKAEAADAKQQIDGFVLSECDVDYDLIGNTNI